MEMDSQRIDYAGTQEQFRRWMLTYNFPPFCTGEALHASRSEAS